MTLNAGMTKEVVLVLAGEKFNPALHVKQIYYKLKQHCIDSRLTVLTDSPEAIENWGLPIRTLRLPDWRLSGPRSLWWYKIEMFNPDISWKGPVLYMDLDTVIINKLDKFFTWEPNKFCICQDFNRAFARDYPVSNSSVIRFEPRNQDTVSLYKLFANNRDHWIKQFRGDQDYITHYWKDRPGMCWWPREWAMSWKWELKHGGAHHGRPKIEAHEYNNLDIPYIIPEDCSIVVFHGYPGPYETDWGEQQLIS